MASHQIEKTSCISYALASANSNVPVRAQEVRHFLLRRILVLPSRLNNFTRTGWNQPIICLPRKTSISGVARPTTTTELFQHKLSPPNTGQDPVAGPPNFVIRVRCFFGPSLVAGSAYWACITDDISGCWASHGVERKRTQP